MKQLFQASELPQVALARLGLTPYALTVEGQLRPLLNGERTDLMPMVIDGQPSKGRLVFRRAPDGAVALKLALPKPQTPTAEEPPIS